MKISAEVREFARLNPSPLAGEGGPHREDDGRVRGVEPTPDSAGSSAEALAEAGMAEMSARDREGGNELYIGANGREHD